MPLSSLLESAYSISRVRMVLPEELKNSNERFDWLAATLKNPHAEFQQQLTRKFGLQARRVMLETEVLLLKARSPNSPGLGLTGPNAQPIRYYVRQLEAMSEFPLSIKQIYRDTMCFPRRAQRRAQREVLKKCGGRISRNFSTNSASNSCRAMRRLKCSLSSG